MLCEIEEKINILILLNTNFSSCLCIFIKHCETETKNNQTKTVTKSLQTKPKDQYLALLCYPHLMCSTLGNMAHLDRAAIEGE